MRVLVTGACGLIGRAVTWLGAGEHTFVLLDSASEVESVGGFRATVLDRSALLRAAEGCDAIVHTAALHARYSETASNEEYLQTNVIGTHNVFDAALAHGIRRVVVSSSLTVNIGIAGAAARPVVIDERSQPRPDHMYPASKLLAEQLGHYYAQAHGLEVVQLRYGYVRKSALTSYGMGLLSRSISVEDAARANLLALTRKGLSDHVFLLAAKTPFVADDLVIAELDPWAVLEKYWPGSREVLQRTGREVSATHLYPIFRIDQAREILGWEPRMTFETYLEALGWRRPLMARSAAAQAAVL